MSPSDSASGHAPTPAFVGRGPHLDRLLTEAAGVAGGLSHATLLLGDAGIGKTRLIAEYLERSPLAQSAVGGCLEMGTEGVAFAPFASVVRQLVRDGVTGGGAAGTAGGELARLVPGLGAAPAATEESRARLFEAVLTLLEERSRPGGLVVVVEDLHWSDASTRDLLVFLIRNLDTAPVHLVVSVRSDDLHRTHPLRRLLPDLERLPRVSRLDLAPFSRGEVAQQAAALGHSSTDPDLLLERSGGNPLFVESFLSDPDPLGTALPDGPRELLLRAVEPLPEATRRVLGLASVAGDRVDHVLLAEVADRSGLSEDELDQALRPAIDARVLRTTGTGYVFRHALLADAVFDDLMPGERVRAHRRYADAAEQGLPGLTSGESAAHLARHAYAAHDHPRALTAGWEAAGHAVATAAHPEHLALLERVLELWELVPDAAERLGLPYGELLRRTCLAAQVSGSLRRAVAHASAGLRETDPAAEPELTAGLLFARGRALKDLGRSDALEDLHAADELLPEEHPGRPAVATATATVLMLLGRDEEAEEAARRAVGVAQRAGDRVNEVDALMTLASLASLWDKGYSLGTDPADGSASWPASRSVRGPADADLLRRVVRIAQETGQVQLEVRGWRHLSAHLAHDLRLQESYRAAERGLERCAELGVLRTQGLGCASAMASQLNNMGRTGEAWELLRLFPHGQEREEARVRSLMSLLCTFRGEWQQAQEALDTFVRLLPRDVSTPMEYLNYYYSAMYLRMCRGELIAAARVVEEGQADIGMLDSGRFYFHGLAVVGELVARLRRLSDPEAARLAEFLTERLGANLRHDRGEITSLGLLGRRILLGFLATDPVESLAHMEEAIPVAESAHHWGLLSTSLSGALRAAYEVGEDVRARELLERYERLADEDDVFLLRQELADLRALLEPGSEPEAPRAAPAALPSGVTPREAEVLAEVAKGLSNREVGEALFISAKTVSVHLTNLMAKLGADNRTAAVAKGRELGLL
ncbi:helix-turn-helix transcriptional regulator [Nocardiopsis nanhaiensis]